MLAKSNWFQKRKYGGWGLSPKTWQGWLYILAFISVLIVFNALPFWSNQARIIFLIVWMVVLGFDVIKIMITLKKDELEIRNEAIAERNASWIMVFVLTAGILYEIISSGLNENFRVNIFLIIALVLGLVTKTLTYLFLEKK
ncbi:MAG: hypothetical protein GF347_01030 [Candidatus Moranbacteria bacterium]|nr:hypothetical protein [Candidatus Moranbacteria bacterium]